MLIFGPGISREQFVNIEIRDDELIEINETITLELISDDPDVDTTNGSSLLVIIDNDGKC